MGNAIDHLTAVWDEVTNDFLRGRPTNTKPPLDRYFASYRMQDEIQLAGFCEPYLGPVDRKPKMVFLSLNPGQLIPSYQMLDHDGREGIFVSELRQSGSYERWAASWPYLREPWRSFIKARKKGQDHHGVRLKFLRDWYQDRTMDPNSRVDFELYPWHSVSFVGANLELDVDIIREFVWDPLGELQAPIVFAFGSWWWKNLKRLGVEVIARLGYQGDRPFDIGYKAGSRQGLVVASAPHGGLVIAEKHGGPPPGPPRTDLVPTFRDQIITALPSSVRAQLL